MIEQKEKSAVGTAIPATEKDITNNPKEIISDESVKIKVVLQKSGKISEITEIENSIGTTNDIVGGLSTEVTIPENGLKLIMNMHSDRRGMPTLKTLWGRIFGTVIIAAKEENRYISLTTEQIQSARTWLMKHTYEEEKRMKLFEYSETFAQLFDSFDAICGYEPEQNEDGEYIDDDGNIIPDPDAYIKDMQTAWFDTLDGIEEEFDIKAENVACFIKQLEGELDMIKKQKAAFERRRKAKENQIKRLEDYLLECMNRIHRTHIEAVKAKISVRTNAETAKFDSEKDFIKWAKDNAPELLNYGEPTIYKTLVKNALKSGRELPGASLGRTQSLTIK